MDEKPSIEITLNSYRCFQEPSPVTLSLVPGKTIALIGKNNAGKSTLLRFFYELRYQLLDFSSGSWTSIGVHASQDKARNLTIGERYGLRDPLDMYPNSDPSKRVRFTFSSAGQTCEFEIYRPDGDLAHMLVKRMMVNPANIPIRSEDQASVARLFQNTLYFGANRNLVNEGAGGGNYFDLSVGTAFTNEWNHLKNGVQAEFAALAIKAESLIADLMGWNALSINASADNKQLLLTVNGTRRLGISELGAGVAELVICIVTAAVKKPSWILIDEPESHLHPALQVKFVEALTLLASHGVVFTTHSIGLARTCADETLVMQQDKLGRSSLRSFEAATNYSQLMGELSFSQLHDLGFNKLLLCEGVTEVKTMRQILRRWHLDASVMLIPLGGTSLIDGNRQDELNEFNRFGVEVFVLIDSEKASEDSNDPVRSRFLAVCEKLFGPKHAIQTNWRATENYFTADAIQGALRSEKYRALERFESSKDVTPFWGKNQNWKIAAEMSKDDWKQTDIGEFMEFIAST
jgi:ABC-type cobalamin/Fe3+-siderophores transport system ATPase subunit